MRHSRYKQDAALITGLGASSHQNMSGVVPWELTQGGQTSQKKLWEELRS